jgi:RNA polymerase sigma factor (sigma-70 family)
MDHANFITLTQRAQGGDQAALNELCHELNVRLGPIVKHKIWWWPKEDQDDVLQATLTLFIEKLPEILENPCGYAVQILSNQIGNEIQKRRRRQGNIVRIETTEREDDYKGGGAQSSERYLASDDNPARTMESREEFEIVVRAINRLTPFCRMVFKGMIEELSPGEIWEAVERTEPSLTRATFYKRIFDCRKRLRQLIAAAN